MTCSHLCDPEPRVGQCVRGSVWGVTVGRTLVGPTASREEMAKSSMWVVVTLLLALARFTRCAELCDHVQVSPGRVRKKTVCLSVGQLKRTQCVSTESNA